MAAVPTIVHQCRSEMRKIEIHLNRIGELHGARNARGSYEAARDAICAATEIINALRPLRERYGKQYRAAEQKGEK